MPVVMVTPRGWSFKLFFCFYRNLFGTRISALTGSKATSMPWENGSAAIFLSDIVRMRSVMVLLCPLCNFLRSLRGVLLCFAQTPLLWYFIPLFPLMSALVASNFTPWSPVDVLYDRMHINKHNQRIKVSHTYFMILSALHDTIHCALLKIGARKTEKHAFSHFLGLLIKQAAASEDSESLVIIAGKNWSFSLFQWSAGYNHQPPVNRSQNLRPPNTGAHTLCVENVW